MDPASKLRVIEQRQTKIALYLFSRQGTISDIAANYSRYAEELLSQVNEKLVKLGKKCTLKQIQVLQKRSEELALLLQSATYRKALKLYKETCLKLDDKSPHTITQIVGTLREEMEQQYAEIEGCPITLFSHIRTLHDDLLRALYATVQGQDELEDNAKSILAIRWKFFQDECARYKGGPPLALFVEAKELFLVEHAKMPLAKAFYNEFVNLYPQPASSSPKAVDFDLQAAIQGVVLENERYFEMGGTLTYLKNKQWSYRTVFPKIEEIQTIARAIQKIQYDHAQDASTKGQLIFLDEHLKAIRRALYANRPTYQELGAIDYLTGQAALIKQLNM